MLAIADQTDEALIGQLVDLGSNLRDHRH